MTQLAQHICIRLLADAAAELRPVIDGIADRDTLDNIDQSISQAKAAADGDVSLPELEERAAAATKLIGKLELFSQGLFLDKADRESQRPRVGVLGVVILRSAA